MLIDLYQRGVGGGATHVQALTEELQKMGHVVTICTIGSKSLPEFEENNGVKIYRFKGFFEKMPFLFSDADKMWHPPTRDWLLTRKLEEIIKKVKPDVIHAHDFVLYSILPVKKKFNIPLVVTLHNYCFFCPSFMLRKNCKIPLTKNCIRCAKWQYGFLKSFLVYFALKNNFSKLKYVDKFIAINPFKKRVFLKYLCLKKEDIVIIPNPINIETFSPYIDMNDKRRYEKKFGINPDMDKIVYAGTLRPSKFDAFVSTINAVPEIVEKFPNTIMLLVGEGEFLNYVKDISKRINQRLNRTAIIPTGGMRSEEMPIILNLADIVIGVGRVALEAMACAKPVIIAGSIVGLSGGNYGGLVTPNNVNELWTHNFSGRNSLERTSPENIAQECLRLLADEKYRASIGKFARTYIRKYDVRKIAKQVETVYYDVIRVRAKH